MNGEPTDWWTMHVVILVLVAVSLAVSAIKAAWLYQIHRRLKELELRPRKDPAGSSGEVITYEVVRRTTPRQL